MGCDTVHCSNKLHNVAFWKVAMTIFTAVRIWNHLTTTFLHVMLSQTSYSSESSVASSVLFQVVNVVLQKSNRFVVSSCSPCNSLMKLWVTRHGGAAEFSRIFSCIQASSSGRFNTCVSEQAAAASETFRDSCVCVAAQEYRHFVSCRRRREVAKKRVSLPKPDTTKGSRKCMYCFKGLRHHNLWVSLILILLSVSLDNSSKSEFEAAEYLSTFSTKQLAIVMISTRSTVPLLVGSSSSVICHHARQLHRYCGMLSSLSNQVKP